MMTATLRSVPRAPGRLPLLGHALTLLRHPIPFLTSLRDQGDVVRIDIGTLPVYFATTPELVHELLISRARSFEKGRIFDRLREFWGDGLPSTEGDVHRRHRRLMQPPFHHARIEEYATVMAGNARAMADSWQPGRTIELTRTMYEFLLGILAEALFSADVGRPAREAVQRHLPVIGRNVVLRTLSPMFLNRLPIPTNRRFHSAVAGLRQVIDDLIAATRRRDDTDHADLLSKLLTARNADTGETMSDQEVRDEVVTILAAAVETTAATLCWAFHEIARHPDVEERVFAELDAVVGTRPVDFFDVAKLDYLDRVLHESTRLHSIALLMRRTVVPLRFGGFDLPAGTEIGLSPYALHRDPRVYQDPERFDPERWLSARPVGTPSKTFIPFGSGNRKCLGDSFAWTEMIITLATVLARWRLRPASGHVVREVLAATPRPDRLPMVAVPR